MQNTPQTFRGVGAPGVNFNDHSYDNHIGGHCQPAGYQPYSSPPFHPSPRPHHYAPPNHQMQQPGMPPYRHHAYPQQQYGVSQQPHDMYRNHHSGYRMPAKPWPENNNNNGAPYGSHPQMQQQPMNVLRSPPHVNAPPPPPQNHFRQMQSPAHSPHSSWSQVPSPMHRTTPSPAHTPGQFPTPPHHQENGVVVDNPGGNPLHSLQKMVMLDQDKMMVVDEQFQNQCVPPASHNYMPEESAESKDSSYSTYYNMDENRFESKPNAAAYSVQVSPNCNYPVPQLNNAVEEAKGSSSIPAPLSNSSIPDGGLSSDHSSLSSPSSVPLMPVCSSSIVNDHPLTLNECHPQHAESAPVFNDQTQAAVSNSEQALESRVSPKSGFDILPLGDIPAADVPNSLPVAPGQVVLVKSENTNPNETVHSGGLGSEVLTNDIKNVKDDIGSNSQNAVPEYKEEKCDPEIPKNEKYNPAIIKVQAEVHNSDVDTELVCEESKNNSEGPCDKTASPEGESSTLKSEKDIECIKLSPKSENLSFDSDESKLKELARNPVKVVIHRIRKDDTNDTWHVPGNESGEEDKKPEVAKIPSVGPQIVILSPAVPQKKFGFHSSVTENNVITIDEDDSVEALDSTKSPPVSSKGGDSAQSPDKKRGRPVGSKNRLKPAAGAKRKRGGGGKGSRKRKPETKAAAEPPPKSVKKGKAFNGPYVHIVGSRENPSSIKVVNVAQQKEEEKPSAKPALKRNFPSAASSRMKRKPVGHLSTLSPTYDAFNRDKTWLCVFCQKGSHQGGLGDLYGPYYIKDKEGKMAAASSSSGPAARRKRCRSEADEGRSSTKKAKQASGHTPIESTPSLKSAHNTSGDSAAESPDLREVWIHEDCAVWCQSISLIGEEVQGLEEAVLEAREHICCKCSFHGATLGCWGKCCKEQYHFSCAKEIGCQMDIENFSLLCLKHQKKSPERRK